MIEEMKKLSLKKFLLLALALFPRCLFSLEFPEAFSKFVLQNGMTVFAYEDFSAPTVKIEYTAKAGFSCQSAATAGYAPLYAQLFSRAGFYSSANKDGWLLDGLAAECAADSARYTIEAAPNQAEEILTELSQCAFAPIFSDAELGKKLKEAKESAAQNAFSAEGFINSAIDSRVFSAAPWKHDSGIYPALFQKQSLSEARAVLSEMARNYYSPQNSALFITGAVSREAALALAQKTFGSFPPGPAFVPQDDSAAAAGMNGGGANGGQGGIDGGANGKKFVLTDPELSPDMAQVVCQFTSLSMEEADVAAVILNGRQSALKAALTSRPELNIRGSDYVNADAAHKNGSSRLIIQSLLEKSKAGDYERATLFEEILGQEAADFTEDEFEAAKEFLLLDFDLAAGNPRGFMELLSQFWAVDGMAKKSYEQSGQEGDASSLVQRFLARQQRIKALDCEELKFALQNAEPFFFVLLNSKNYKGQAAAFEQDGWKSVSQKNASWHAQEMFAKIKDSIESKGDESQEETAPQIFDPAFRQKTLESAKSAALQNGINVFAKINPASSTSAVCLYIKGGEAECAQKEPGLEAVLASVLAQNARKACSQKILSGQMKGAVNVSAQCEDVSALVCAECLSGDEGAALEALAEALFISEIIPAEVDVYLSSRKSAQIIKSAAMPRQLHCAGIKAFYKAPLYRALNSSNQDILRNVSYREILEEYARLLDAGRLEIIAAGNFDFDSLVQKAREAFEGIPRVWQEKELFAQAKEITKPAQKVKINHTFLTDVSADKAGPRPAVLVPTTDFADPAQYWFSAPQGQKEAALFDALMTELGALCQESFAAVPRRQKMTARLEEKSPLVSFGALTIFNVQYISDADSAMQEALLKLKEELSQEEGGAQNAALDKIKSLWLKTAFEGADKNAEGARAIAKKLDQARAQGKDFDIGAALLADYEAVTQAGAADFLAVYQACFEKHCKFYSDAAKK